MGMSFGRPVGGCVDDYNAVGQEVSVETLSARTFVRADGKMNLQKSVRL